MSLLTKLLGVPQQVVGMGQADPSGVNGQLSVILTDAAGNQGTMSTTLYGFSPTNAVIVGTGGTVRFGSEFNLPGPFEVISADGRVVLRYQEPAGRHFEGLYYEAAEVARCISSGRLESSFRRSRLRSTPWRRWTSSAESLGSTSARRVWSSEAQPWAPRPRVDNAMVKALARALRWRRMLDTGVHGTLDDLRVGGVHPDLCQSILRLALLAPDIIEAMRDGREPAEPQLKALLSFLRPSLL